MIEQCFFTRPGAAVVALTLSLAFRVNRSYFTLHQIRSTNTLSRRAPRPSMDSLLPTCSMKRVNSSAVFS